MNSTNGVIWVVGHGFDTHKLVHLITGRHTNDVSEHIDWRIRTKYYEAATQLRLIKADAEAATISAAAPEAVVLVFDAAAEQTFEGVRAWWQQQGEAAGAEIMLAVADCAEPESRAQWVKEAEKWASEEGFEYVRVCTAKAEQDEELAAAEEGHGVSRVTAALHAHMWPNMALLQRPQGECRRS